MLWGGGGRCAAARGRVATITVLLGEATGRDTEAVDRAQGADALPVEKQSGLTGEHPRGETHTQATGKVNTRTWNAGGMITGI